jgi:hypothetical protein
VVLVLVTIASYACGGTTVEQLQEAVEEQTSTTSIVEPTMASTNEMETEPIATLQPLLTTTPVPEAESIQFVAQGFGQDEQELGFAFIIKNPNVDIAFESTQYQVAVYDDAGTVLETDSGYIELILPGNTLGVAGTMWLDEGMTVSSLEVQLLEGDSVQTDPIPTFNVQSGIYYEGEYSDTVTGVINSPYNIYLKDIRVSAVVYNEGGEIIGGGFTYLNFILANNSTGVKVSVTASGDVASVELYPTVSGLTFLSKETELPEGASNIVLAKQGFGQDDQEIGFGMLIENPNGNFAIENSQYHITAFGENGNVLATEEGYVKVFLPNQTLGVAGTTYLIEDTDVVRIDAQILAGDFVESSQLPYFSSENVTYHPDEYFPKVTGQIVNPYNKDITDLRVSTILYNEAEDIIGGGFTYLDFIPANGKSAVEVSVTSSGTPAATELFAAVSSLSEFE